MSFKRHLILLICICATLITVTSAFAADAKYCALLKQIHPGMKVRDVFLVLGPPHTFSQPPNLDLNAMYNKSTTVMQPQASIANSSTERDMMLQVIDTDPILQAFINADPNSTNVLIWQYENNTLTISVNVKGSTVLDVKANFSC